MKRGAIEEENTALAGLRSEENPGSGPGEYRGVYPNHPGRQRTAMWAICCDNSQDEGQLVVRFIMPESGWIQRGALRTG